MMLPANRVMIIALASLAVVSIAFRLKRNGSRRSSGQLPQPGVTGNRPYTPRERPQVQPGGLLMNSRTLIKLDTGEDLDRIRHQHKIDCDEGWRQQTRKEERQRVADAHREQRGRPPHRARNFCSLGIGGGRSTRSSSPPPQEVARTCYEPPIPIGSETKPIYIVSKGIGPGHRDPFGEHSHGIAVRRSMSMDKKEQWEDLIVRWGHLVHGEEKGEEWIELSTTGPSYFLPRHTLDSHRVERRVVFDFLQWFPYTAFLPPDLGTEEVPGFYWGPGRKVGGILKPSGETGLFVYSTGHLFIGIWNTRGEMSEGVLYHQGEARLEAVRTIDNKRYLHPEDPKNREMLKRYPVFKEGGPVDTLNKRRLKRFLRKQARKATKEVEEWLKEEAREAKDEMMHDLREIGTQVFAELRAQHSQGAPLDLQEAMREAMNQVELEFAEPSLYEAFFDCAGQCLGNTAELAAEGACC